MNFNGKIIHISDKRSGTSQSGKPWSVQEYVIEDTSGRYPSRMCFSVFGDDRIAQFNIHLGDVLSVSFDLDARQHNGRWFNSIQAYAVTRLQAPAAYSQRPAPGAQFAAMQQPAAATYAAAPVQHAADATPQQLPF